MILPGEVLSVHLEANYWQSPKLGPTATLPEQPQCPSFVPPHSLAGKIPNPTSPADAPHCGYLDYNKNKFTTNYDDSNMQLREVTM